MARFLISYVLLMPAAAFAAPRTFSELMDMVTNLINGGIGVALILAIVLYFYGIVSNYAKSSEKSFEKVRMQILWGILALFVMFSVWGILALLRNTLFGGETGLGGGGDQTLCESLEDCVIE